MFEFMSLAIFCVIALFSWRIVNAKTRLQSCIDKGVIEYECGRVVIPDDLNDVDRNKIERELRIFLAAARGGPGFLRLHSRDSYR